MTMPPEIRKGDILTHGAGVTSVAMSKGSPNSIGVPIVAVRTDRFIIPADRASIVRVERDGVVVWDADTALEQLALFAEADHA